MDETMSPGGYDIVENSPQSLVRTPISAHCPRYACEICRTKTGWPHQIGCEMSLVTEHTCAYCRYWNTKKSICNHPAVRKERAAR